MKDYEQGEWLFIAKVLMGEVAAVGALTLFLMAIALWARYFTGQ